MKSNFVDRTGKSSSFNVAGEIEKRLAVAHMLPFRKTIPRSTMNRLLSAEAFRNRVGFSVTKRKFIFTHDEPIVLGALHRIADDLARKRIVLGDIWDVDGKQTYLDRLENEGVLPVATDILPRPDDDSSGAVHGTRVSTPLPTAPPRRTKRTTLIPNTPFAVAWAGRIQRHRAIWEELQSLHLVDHPNAISVLLRVLLELSTDNDQVKLGTVGKNDPLAKRVLRVAEDLHKDGKIDKKYLGVFKKFQQLDPLVSMDTLNRYVHSRNFAPSPEHLTALWDTLSDYVVECLNV